MKRIIPLILSLIAIVVCSCGSKSYDQLTPVQQQKEYTQFQKDSLYRCTADKVAALSAVKGAFDRVPENNGFWKRDKVDLNYDDSLKCWVGVVEYHVDRNGSYYKAYKTFHVKYWAENNGLTKDMKVFYTVKEVPNSPSNASFN